MKLVFTNICRGRPIKKKQRIDVTNLFYYPDIIVEKGKGVYEAMNSLVTLWLT